MWKKVELTGLTPVASLEGAALDWAVTSANPNTEHDGVIFASATIQLTGRKVGRLLSGI
jgi:hypothetical protein